MSANHSVSDLVAIIRNGYLAKRNIVSSPISKLREGILKILEQEGYILSYSRSPDSKKFDIHLKYHFLKPVVSEINVISKPGKRIYCKSNEIPVVKNGLGVVVISTSKGVVADSFARSMKVGGEVLLKIF